MKIHEYQAKALLAEWGIPVPRGKPATSPAQAKEIASELGGRVVVKAQVYAGGRGKAGGIKIASSPAEAEDIALQMLGKRLVTHQTSPQGVPINQVLLEEAVEVERELYLSLLIDPALRQPVMLASEAGGMEIEEIARTNPDKILKAPIDPATGFQPYQGRKLGYGLSLEPPLLKSASELMSNLYRLFQTRDCSLAEINPLAITADKKLLALDAKLNFDDNALFRHPEIAALRDLGQEDPLEVEAHRLGVRNYVKLDGNIGCLVNGAGLSMAVLDLLTQMGGKPANFLDIGTVNTPERVVNAFKLFNTDPAVKAVLINIFGGVARADVIAQGIVQAHKEMTINLPVVVRLAGTKVEEGKRILKESGLRLIYASDLADAAQKATEAARGERL